MKKALVINLFLSILALNAQSKTIFESIVVESDTADPVAEAKVTIEETIFITLTDENGFFSFSGDLAEGDYIVSVSKPNYEPLYFSIEYRNNTKIKLEQVKIDVTKKEAKRRKKERRKKEKEIAERLKQLEKEKREKEKLLKKKRKELLKENTVAIQYDSVKKIDVEPEAEVISAAQIKYAEVLGVDPLELSNKELYEFIDKWEGTPYEWGASSKDAIDCSAFTQRILIKAKDMIIERTAQKQFDSKYTDKFVNKEYLKEGDLIFFGKDKYNVTHVGMYLHNNKFVHATSKDVDGPSGVKISDLNHPYWIKTFVSAGRRINNE